MEREKKKRDGERKCKIAKEGRQSKGREKRGGQRGRAELGEVAK